MVLPLHKNGLAPRDEELKPTAALIQARFLNYARSSKSFSIFMSARDIKKKADVAKRP